MAEIRERIAYARAPRRLPSLKARAALTTAYAAGLRVSEVTGLRVADIDSGRRMIRIEHGKAASSAM